MGYISVASIATFTASILPSDGLTFSNTGLHLTTGMDAVVNSTGWELYNYHQAEPPYSSRRGSTVSRWHLQLYPPVPASWHVLSQSQNLGEPIWASFTLEENKWRSEKFNLCKADAFVFHMLVYSMLPRPILECEAAADAMATETVVGIGGYISFPSRLSGWFQLQLGPSDFQAFAPWATVPLQHKICGFELLGQCLLLQLVTRLLKGFRQHCTFVTSCDNTSNKVAAAKGNCSIGIWNILLQSFRYQLMYDIFQQVHHIPGYRSTAADALSRFGDHDLPTDRHISVDWQSCITPIIFRHARFWHLNHVWSYWGCFEQFALESLLHLLFTDWQAILIYILHLRSDFLRVGVSFRRVYRFLFWA